MAERHPQQTLPPSQIFRSVSAAVAGGSLLLLSGFVLAGAVIALVVAAPLLVILSPVVVPAAVACFLIVSGFVISGVIGATVISVAVWMRSYLAGGHPVGARQIEDVRARLAAKIRDVQEAAHRRIHQA